MVVQPHDRPFTVDEYCRLVQVAARGQRVSPLFAPDLTIEVDAILGPS